MKKSKCAVFALAAISGAASAQSSVSLYGVIDEGLVIQSNSLLRAANPATGSPGTSARKYFLDSGSGLNGSRWGIRGSEDLGGGLKALFQVENGFNLDTGGFSQGGLEFGRQAYVGLGSSRFGIVTLGRQYDSVVDYVGPIIFADQIGSAYGALPGDLNNANNDERVNNAVKYTSSNFAGLTLGGLYSVGGVAGSTARNQIWSVGGVYARGPAQVAGAFLKVNQPNVSFFSNSAVSAGSLGTALTSVTTPVFSGYMTANSYQVAAAGVAYAIGPVNMGVIYSNTQFQHLQSSTATPGLPTGGQGTAIFNSIEANAVWHITPSTQLGGAYSRVNGSSVSNRSGKAFGGSVYNQFALSADYAISKRTDVYILGSYQIASGIDSTGAQAQADISTLTPSSDGHQAVARLGLRSKF